jgi:hypothetical protein
MTTVPSNLLTSANQTVTSVTSQVQNLSAGAQARLSIIEAAIPDRLFTVPDTNLNGRGSLSLGDVEERVTTTVNQTVEQINNGIPNLSNLPSVGGILKEVVYNKIKSLKKQQQEAVISSQLQAAKLEETPFTARKELLNQRNQQIFTRLTPR